jgi:hypothetical protein
MHFSRILLGLLLFLFALPLSALEVNVQSPSNGVSALGFSLNGKSYGGMGRSYVKSNLTPGAYQFGVRVGGIFGKDIPCLAANNQAVQLKNNTTAILTYSNNRCTVQISSK